MKKFLTMLFATLFVLSLVACDTSSGGEIQKPSDVSSNNASSESQNADKTTAGGQKPTITETVLVDESGIKITAKKLNADNIFGPEIQLLIENNSGKDLTVQSRNASVNGYMVETMLSADVVNGKKANSSLTFMESDLKACGISTIADVEFSFHIFTTADWETYLDTPQIKIKTSVAETYQYTFDDSGNIAYDGNNVKIVIKGLSKEDSILGPGIIVYMENNSGKNITVQTRAVSVNGFMLEPVFSADLIEGKHAVDAITFMSSQLEENEITEIKTVELSFHIFDSDSWNTIVDTQTITLTF